MLPFFHFDNPSKFVCVIAFDVCIKYPTNHLVKRFFTYISSFLSFKPKLLFYKGLNIKIFTHFSDFSA